jgi:hypothetical protein
VVRVRKARAIAVLAAAANVPVTASRRPPLLEAAADLEALGDFARASEAYARAHDVEGQARALARAGEVDRLDFLLEAEHSRERAARALRSEHDEFALRVASGRRREAVALAQASADANLRARGEGLLASAVRGPVVAVTLRGRGMHLILGERVVVGRAPEGDGTRDGAIVVPSLALSRSHLALERGPGGAPHVRDLGSRHGTTLDARALREAVPVGDGVALRLGGDVACVVRPADEWPGAVAVEVAGARYVAPLGAASPGIGRWTLARSELAWVELLTEDAPPAFAGGLRLAPRVTVLAGDAIGTEIRGAAAMVFGEPTAGHPVSGERA